MASISLVGKTLTDCSSACSLAYLSMRFGSSYCADMVTETTIPEAVDPSTTKSSHTGGLKLRPLEFYSRVSLTNRRRTERHEASLDGLPTSSGEKTFSLPVKKDHIPLFIKKIKRSDQVIRHDQLYLKPKEPNERECSKTWTDFPNKRSVPVTEWGTRPSE